jgi:hypothetical protein
MSNAKNLDWQTYESITKYIYESLGQRSGVKIVGYGSTCKKKGKSGVSHQIDVITSHTDGIHSYETAIECKYWKDKVNKETVMKLSETIEDTGKSKGIIVSKNGFTQDGIEYAKYRNIGLVELREFEKKDLQHSAPEMEIGTIDLNFSIIRKRPEILSINIGDNRKMDIKHEFDYLDYTVILQNETQRPFYDYVNDFRNEINSQNKKSEIITKSYKIPGSKLNNRRTDETLHLNEIIFSGNISETDLSRKVQINLVDKVWLIMKSIFDERTFTFSENGLIIEHKKRE